MRYRDNHLIISIKIFRIKFFWEENTDIEAWDAVIENNDELLEKYIAGEMCIRDRTDADPETGCMEFDIEKGRFSFRLTAPYSEERREACLLYTSRCV